MHSSYYIIIHVTDSHVIYNICTIYNDKHSYIGSTGYIMV